MPLYHTKRYKGTTTTERAQISAYYYIIPKDIRELRLKASYLVDGLNYIIPKDIRELRPLETETTFQNNYIIPKDIRELRLMYASLDAHGIISYQKI